MVKEQHNIIWDTRKGGLIAATELRIGSIMLKSKPLSSPAPEKVQAAIRNVLITEGKALLSFDEKFEQLQNRILSLRTWNPNEGWPDVTTPALLAEPDWIMLYTEKAKRNEDLRNIDLSAALLHSLDWDLQQKIADLAPVKIAVPSGSSIKLEYFANGNMPVLSVRLQEVFGMADTPKINNGKQPVLLHLLSPGYKPVQVTSDLKSFWNNTYYEVRNELKRRYPKHAWPDDPWSAKAVAKGRQVKG
jgi:ATP-dependent helicase HrpB